MLLYTFQGVPLGFHKPLRKRLKVGVCIFESSIFEKRRLCKINVSLERSVTLPSGLARPNSSFAKFRHVHVTHPPFIHLYHRLSLPITDRTFSMSRVDSFTVWSCALRPRRSSVGYNTPTSIWQTRRGLDGDNVASFTQARLSRLQLDIENGT
jgi:hypothetical protein